MSWSVAMTTAMPAVKPVVTGWGMNWMSRPSRSAPIAMQDDAGHHRGDQQPAEAELRRRWARG